MFTDNRNELRNVFRQAWRKRMDNAAMEPLEALVAQVVQEHPEYHSLLEGPEENLERDYLPEMGETNPFLHMAMHLAIREQLAAQRPPGIVAAYQAMLEALPDAHRVEHEMMECLAESLWQAQRTGQLPDERAYLECLRQRGQH
ncbi:MAG: hypothetical protein AMS22_01075 [Thiotrichales bacterium SG8_50]|nr:MAG: hypothetical protein AMS22_01075 [Thiotrichales bacterium SG8_50]